MTVPADEIRRRIRAFRRELKTLDGGTPDYVMLTSEPNVRYLSGFPGKDAALLISPRTSWLITDNRYTQVARAYCPVAKVVAHTGGYLSAIPALTRPRKGARPVLGFEDSQWTVAYYTKARTHLKDWTIRPVPMIAEQLRRIKSDYEIGLLKRAIRIQQQAAVAWRRELRPGMTERQAASLLRHLMVSGFGAEDESFETIVAFDGNASMPHHIPGNTRLKKNSLVLIDWGARYDGYHSDMTRTFFVGKPNPTMLKIHKIVLEAQRKGVKMVKSGNRTDAVDRATRTLIAESGYGDCFLHGTGHGIGLEIHEGPAVSTRNPSVLTPGHVITVEPGIYIPELGGVRIEDDILVTGTGARNLCTLSRDPISDW